MANHPQSYYRDIGTLGEDLVCQWLQSTGWIILHRQWRRRFGEIDIIAEKQEDTSSFPSLVFVEVKARSPGNWDNGGRSAVQEKKQHKLWRTAQMFLAQFPQKADYFCRFDVAIVCVIDSENNLRKTDVHHQALDYLSNAEYKLILEEYIAGAFTFDGQ